MGASGWRLYDYDAEDNDLINSTVYLSADNDENPTKIMMDIKVAVKQTAVVKPSSTLLSSDKVCMQTDNANIWKYVTYEEAFKTENKDNARKDAGSEEDCLKNNKTLCLCVSVFLSRKTG